MSQASSCAICGLPTPDDSPFEFCPSCLYGGLLDFIHAREKSEGLRAAGGSGLLDGWAEADPDAGETPDGVGPPAPLDDSGGPAYELSPAEMSDGTPPTAGAAPRSPAPDAGLTPRTPTTGPGADGTAAPPAEIETVRFPGLYQAAAGNAAGEGRTGAPARRDFPKVAGYEIRGVLGAGGMGVVYRALQVRADRMVALKMIRGDAYVSFEQLERFRVEARAVGQLHHPNVVQIFDVGEAGHLPYFSIELLEGGTLRDRLAAGPMPHAEAAELVQVLAGGVHAAHRAGIVHRDLKPANVLFDSGGTPKITDFGLAKRLEEEGQTITGQVVGTPSYMAPEQARGDSRSVGPLADVYALGAILYTALTGGPPFRGVDVHDTLSMVLSRDPVPPSRIQPKVPRDLETICLKCLLKDPARRYTSARELADDIGRYRAGRPIIARPTPAWEHAVKWARRRPLYAAALVCALAAGAGLAAAVAYSDRREKRRVENERAHAVVAYGRGRGRIAADKPEEAIELLTPIRFRLAAEPKLGDIRRLVDDALNDARRLKGERERRTRKEAAEAAAQRRFTQFGKLRDEAFFRDGDATFVADESLEPGEEGASAGGPAPRDEPTAASRRDEQVRRTRAAARDALDVFDLAGGAPGADARDAIARLEPNQNSTLYADCYVLLLVLSEATAEPLGGEDGVAQAREGLRWLERAAALHAPTREYHSRRAACLEQAGDPGAARAARAQAEALTPAEALEHFLLGRECYRNGDWDAAEAHLDAAIRKQPDAFWAHWLRATVKLKQVPRRAAEARDELDFCVTRQPNYARLYLLRGFSNAQLGATWAGAAAAAAAAPGGPGRYRAKAKACFDGAEADFRHALELGLDANLEYALLMNRGVMRFQQGGLEAAAADFGQAIARNGNRYNAHVSLAQVDRKLGRRATAVDRIGKGIALQPGMSELYRARAFARLDEPKLSGPDAEAALRDLETASRLAREPRDAAKDHARRGRLLLRLGRPLDALAAADSALRSAGDLAEAHRVRISALMELKRYDAMLEACDAALAAKVDGTPDLYWLRGLARAGGGDFVGAIEDYTRALAQQPYDRAEVTRSRGWSYIYANSFELARRDFEALTRANSNDAEALAGRAAALVRLGRVHDALLDIERALGQAGALPRVLFIGAQVYSLASARAADEAARRGRPASRDSLAYESRAAGLLEACLRHTPSERRGAFWRDVVARDPVLVPLLRNPTIVRRLKPPGAAGP
jgi:tetratricopeptide (TPR) repeat protein